MNNPGGVVPHPPAQLLPRAVGSRGILLQSTPAARPTVAPATISSRPARSIPAAGI